MNGAYGSSWKYARGLGGTVSSPLGGWAGHLFADGPRLFTTPMGEPVADESKQRLIDARAFGGSVFGARSFGEVPAEQVVTSAAQATSGQKLSETVTELAPAITTIIEATQDPYRRYEVAKAKYENALSRGASAAHLNKLEAKYRAAAARLGLKEESVTATRQWRALGQTAAFVGIGVGAVLAFFIVVKALK